MPINALPTALNAPLACTRTAPTAMIHAGERTIMTRAAVPHMRKGGWGRIVNNTTSFKTMLRVLPYGAMKSALESMSAVWATR